MKIVYIAHPVTDPPSDDPAINLSKICQIVRELNLSRPDVTPFVPYYLDAHCMNLANPAEHANVLSNIAEILERNIVDEFWLYGTRLSWSMRRIIMKAYILSKPVYMKDAALLTDLKRLSDAGIIAPIDPIIAGNDNEVGPKLQILKGFEDVNL